MKTDTISAIATAPGRGGIGVVRVSGPETKAIAKAILGVLPKPRQAHYTPFLDQQGDIIDEGLGLLFENPHSFTGEDVLELQGHGGPVVLDSVLRRTIELGARLAKPGEFSERAFLNDKLDLTQAEAIADLIDAESEQAARCAMRSLQGEFSKKIHVLVEQTIQLRMYVEAAIDFPEEEIDFLADSTVLADAKILLENLDRLLANANQGVLLRDGIKVVIAGPPNAGKSSLLNALSGRDSAIVTDIAGTTRDVLRESIQLDGVPLHIIDTAGLRDSQDVVEQEGIKRAHQELTQADMVLLVFDVQTGEEPLVLPEFPTRIPVMTVFNKIDLMTQSERAKEQGEVICLSAKTQQGLDTLSSAILQQVGFNANAQSDVIARRRHVDCLETAREFIAHGIAQLQEHNAGELFAEDMRQAQQCLNEITGEFTSDDLLGKIFSSFCIGK